MGRGAAVIPGHPPLGDCWPSADAPPPRLCRGLPPLGGRWPSAAGGRGRKAAGSAAVKICKQANARSRFWAPQVERCLRSRLMRDGKRSGGTDCPTAAPHLSLLTHHRNPAPARCVSARLDLALLPQFSFPQKALSPPHNRNAIPVPHAGRILKLVGRILSFFTQYCAISSKVDKRNPRWGEWICAQRRNLQKFQKSFWNGFRFTE